MSLTTALIAGINALTGAVVVLFLWFRSSYKHIEEILGDRDIERMKLMNRIARLEKRLGLAIAVEDCPVDDCPYRDAMRATKKEGSE